MTMVQLFENIDNAMTLKFNAKNLKTYLMQKDVVTEQQKEIILYILEDKDLQNMLDIRKIQAVKRIFGDK